MRSNVSVWYQVRQALATAPDIWEEVKDEARLLVGEECKAFLTAIYVYIRFNFDMADLLETYPSSLPAKVRYFEKEIDDFLF